MKETGRGVRVALLDTGVNAWHSHVAGVARAVSFHEEAGRVVAVEGDTKDVVGHGTALAGVIRKWAPDATLLSARVLGRDLKGSLQVLVAAIEWAAREEVHVINLSLGTRNAAHRGALEEAIAKARAAGAVVIAAFGRDGEDEREAFSDLPAAIPGVISVGVDPTCGFEGERPDAARILEPGATPSLRASPYPRDIPGVPRERNFHGPSVAVAHASGLAARVIERRLVEGSKNASAEDILHVLRATSREVLRSGLDSSDQLSERRPSS